VALQIPGIIYDGGYAEYVVVPAAALARIPDELSAVEAAPLRCAGVTYATVCDEVRLGIPDDPSEAGSSARKKASPRPSPRC
jgi:NADPH:quinone reductase-like Zn-dependent oxidoreductase